MIGPHQHPLHAIWRDDGSQISEHLNAFQLTLCVLPKYIYTDLFPMDAHSQTDRQTNTHRLINEMK